MPATASVMLSAVTSIKACVLFIGATNPQWPRDPTALDLFKQHNPNVSIIISNQNILITLFRFSFQFEATFIDGPHHLHMTHVDEVAERIEQFFDKYLYQPPVINSQL